MNDFDRKNCPILKKCRHEAFFSPMKIMEMALLLLFGAGSLYVAIKTEEIIWRIGAVVMIAVCAAMFFWLNFYKFRGMHETAAYLAALSDTDRSDLVSQIQHTAVIKPVCLLDGWIFAPSVPILARYEEITGAEVVTRYYNGVKNSYTVILQFRGIKREITMNLFVGFDPEVFKTELESKMRDASYSGCNVVFSEKKL